MKLTVLGQSMSADQTGEQKFAYDKMMLTIEGNFSGALLQIQVRIDENYEWQTGISTDAVPLIFSAGVANFYLVGISRRSHIRAVVVGGDGSTDITPTIVQTEFASGTTQALGLALGTDGKSFDINLQDQVTPPVDIYFTQEMGTPTALAQGTSIDDVEIIVDDATGISIGTYLGIFCPPGSRFYYANVTNVAGTTITLDTPLDFAFHAGDEVKLLTRDLNVSGASGSPQVFGVRGLGSDSPLQIDITRIIVQMITDNIPDFGKFGDIVGGIDNGIVLRRMNGLFNNIFNIKSNSEFSAHSYDLQVYDASNPGTGVNGLACRYSFSGQDKHGVAVRIGTDEALQLIIQDDLSSLLQFRIIAEGHVVD